ncbi:unnamed protein product [Orchesella dallaii]|uniref:Peptidase S1 domain-containing protein n=1 Tax=Orchesella dallaii TaxID=48710 RepID=A0ABP1RI82_9HEXA
MTDKCTATVYCDNKITLAKSTNGKCVKEVFAITDGTEGFMSGCGTFHFGRTPRSPRNKGRDLYVYYKGIYTKSTCIAFCVEDYKENERLKPVKPLSINKDFKGLKMDSSCGKLAFNIADFKPLTFTDAHCFAETGIQAGQIELLFHAHVMDKKSSGGRQPADDDPNFSDIPGWTLPRETDDSEKSIRIEAESVLVHPLFAKTYDFDVAIIKLKRKLDFKTPELSPICMPNIGENPDYKDGESFMVTGWGRPYEKARAGARILQKLEIPFVNLAKCKRYTKASNRHICAGFVEGKKDACAGDSGGPLIHPIKPDGSQYFLSGVVSAGKGCARSEQLGLYTSMQEMSQWIHYHTDGAVWCAR